MIESIDPESDAAEEGLTPQMAILSINDMPIRSIADFNRVVKGLKAGDSAKVEYKTGKNRSDSVFIVVPRPTSN
jgi:S1-C subfamily serine protease